MAYLKYHILMYKFLGFLLLLTSVNCQSTDCAFCRDIVSFVDSEIKEANQTIEVISEVIEDLCYDIGGNIIGEECKIVVEGIQWKQQWKIDWISDERR